MDRDVPLLFSHPECHFTYLARVTPFIDERLFIPFCLGGEGVATIWVVAHDQSCRFDMEDLRLMTNLGNLAAAALEPVDWAVKPKNERKWATFFHPYRLSTAYCR